MSRIRPGAGALDERITIEAETETDDGHGGVTATWAEHARPWASVDFISAAEGVERGALRARLAAVFTIRNRDGITTAMRIVWRGRTYNIREVPPVPPRDPFLSIEADEAET